MADPLTNVAEIKSSEYKKRKRVDFWAAKQNIAMGKVQRQELG